MASRLTRDPYSFSYQEVDSRVSVSLKAEAELRRKTERLQKELQISLLAHHREKIELHDFLADLRAPLGPRVVRTIRKHSLGRGGRGTGGRTATRQPQSEPGRRLSEPATPVDHFPAPCTLRDPFAWIGDGAGDDSDSDDGDDSDVLTIPGSITREPEVPKASLKVNEVRARGARKASVAKTSDTNRRFARLPSIKNAQSMKVPVETAAYQEALSIKRCPAIAPSCPGTANPATEEEPSANADRPRLTISTLANLQTGSSDLRKRIQRWCDNITVELFPFAESERQDGTGERPAGRGGPTDPGVSAPKILVTEDANANTVQDNTDKERRGGFTHPSPPVKSLFLPRNFASQPEPDPLLSVRTAPTITPGSPVKSTKAPSSDHRDPDKNPASSPRKISKATATDLRVISKSMQSFHTCKVYRGRNSIPAAGATDAKAFEDLARAQYRLVQRQRGRSRHYQGISYDFAERVQDAQIKKRNSARWSM